jgi:hypothetical protein
MGYFKYRVNHPDFNILTGLHKTLGTAQESPFR